MALPLTGEQYEITAGEVSAVVTEVGAGLRTLTVGGRPYVEPFPVDSRPPRGAGTVLVPWPNRTKGGRWTWDGAPQQLALNEPAAGNAIHGLLRYTFYEVVDRAPDTITLAARVAPQPGWPVPLATQVRYAVAVDGLTVTHTVTNIGAAAVPFGVGAHPYIRVGDTPTDDCTLQLAATTALPLRRRHPDGPGRTRRRATPTSATDARSRACPSTTRSAAACPPPATSWCATGCSGPTAVSRSGRTPRSAGCRSSPPTTTPAAAAPWPSNR